MAYVNFNKTKPASFALSESADRNTIYFTTDTHDIIVNGKSFGGSTDLTELWKQIDAHTEEIKVIVADLNALKLIVHDNELTTSAALNDLNSRLLDTIDATTIDAMFL